MIILSAAFQITFLLIVSPCIWLEVHSVVFRMELSLSLSLRTAHSLGNQAAAGSGRSVHPSLASASLAAVWQ